MANDEVDGTKVMEVAALADVAKELDIALLAQLAVPIKVPIIWFVTFNEPVIP